MKTIATLCLPLVIAAFATAPASAQPPARVGGDYVFTGDIDLGGPAFWDYVSFDAAEGRLYIGHVDKISVVDVASRKVIGSVAPLREAHGAAIVGELHKGYATSGGDGLLKVFDAGDLHLIKDIPIGKDADAVVYDAHTGLVIVALGDGQKLMLVDPKTDAVVRAIDLPGKPEYSAVDGHGRIYVNIASTAQLARIDIASGRIEAVYPLPGCKDPHGLAYDERTDRLFSGCSNAVLLVVEPATGRTVATLPIGGYSDAVAVDVGRRRVFSANGDGTLTVIREGPDDHYAVERTLPTFLGGRTMAVNPRTGELYVAHGDTKIKGGLPDLLALRFGWDHGEVATFTPND